ncbi:656_t:CDS:1, partial [Funneliformis caledonium]
LIEICNTSITMDTIDTIDNAMDTIENCPLSIVISMDMSIANTASYKVYSYSVSVSIIFHLNQI